MEKKIEFLYGAISDAQELIRFVDTKTAFAISVIGAYVVAFFVSIEKIVEYSCWYSWVFWIFLSLFLLMLILCIIVTLRIIKPTNNPIDNIKFGNLEKPSLKFFLSPNDYSKNSFYPFFNSKKLKLKENYEKYVGQLTGSSDSEILNCLTLELFKVSYIRNIKMDRFNVLLWLLVTTTITFFISYLFFSIETQQIKDYLDS